MTKQKKTTTFEDSYPKGQIIKANIRMFQARQNISDEELMLKMNVSRTTFNRRMNDPHKFEVFELENIARAFGVNPECLWVEPEFHQPRLVIE